MSSVAVVVVVLVVMAVDLVEETVPEEIEGPLLSTTVTALTQ